MSIASCNGPIGRAYGTALRWARAAEDRRYSGQISESFRLKLWEKVNRLWRLCGPEYLPHPMMRQTSLPGKASKFRRRWQKLSAERREAWMRLANESPALVYLTWK